jgi:hypothetical protein
LAKKTSWGRASVKNRIFGPKIGTKIENKVQKLSNSKEKKGLFGLKNKLGLSLRTKERSFLGKNSDKN